jgi:hypothetical protein
MVNKTFCMLEFLENIDTSFMVAFQRTVWLCWLYNKHLPQSGPCTKTTIRLILPSFQWRCLDLQHCRFTCVAGNSGSLTIRAHIWLYTFTSLWVYVFSFRTHTPTERMNNVVNLDAEDASVISDSQTWASDLWLYPDISGYAEHRII